MVSLAHCHSKRGSSRAETAHVKWTEEREGAGPAARRGVGNRPEDGFMFVM